MKLVTISFGIACSIAFLAGCDDKDKSPKWRSDTAPIVKRIPVLSTCTNMLWHGEINTKNSFMSVPGPSAYRVCCFIPNASRVLPLLLDKELSTDTSCENDTFQPAEKAMLKSEFGIDFRVETSRVSEQLNRQLLQPPYWGQCIFFKQKDILCIILYGE